MSYLYLTASPGAQYESTDALIKKLGRVCSMLDAILQSDRSRYLEARTWLLNSITEQSPPPDLRLACWEPLLAEAMGRRDGGDSGGGGGGGGSGGGGDDRTVGSGPGHQELLMQLLVLVSEVWPDRVAAILLERPQVFVEFFQGPAAGRRILLWFSHFSIDGMKAFKYGAHALAHYALAHREEMWDLLRWEGKHAQAPVAVAAKTHYFCELALQSSIRSLVRHHPQFWASAQWRECCRDGAFLELDRRHFCQVLLDQLRGGGGAGAGAARLSALLRDFITSSPCRWQLLCHRLLHQLDERQLLRLLNTLAEGQTLPPPPAPLAAAPAADAAGTAGAGRPLSRPQPLQPALAGVCGCGGWQDLSGLVLRGGVRWGSVAEAVVAHAMAAARGPLQRLLTEEREELAGRLEEVEAAARELHGGGGGGVGGAEKGGAGDDESCDLAAHEALLYGGRLDLRGRSSAEGRLLLLAEMWTLREALRVGTVGGAIVGSAASCRTKYGIGAAAPSEALLPLERVMAAVDGVSFERLQAPGGSSDDGRRRVRQGLAPDAARLSLSQSGPAEQRLRQSQPQPQLPAIDGADGAAAAAAAAAPGTAGAGYGSGADMGRYELLLSEDEDGSDDRRRRRRRGRRKSKSKRRRRDDDGSQRSKQRQRRSKTKGSSSRSESRSQSRSRSRNRSDSQSRGQGWIPSGSRSRSRSRSRGRGRDGSSSSSGAEDRPEDRGRKRRRPGKKYRRRRSHDSRDSRDSSSSSGNSAESSGPGSSSGSGSSSDEEVGGPVRGPEQRGTSSHVRNRPGRRRRRRSRRHRRRHHDRRERDRARDEERRRRSKSPRLYGNRRSSTLRTFAAGADVPYGLRRTDSNEEDREVDPLELLNRQGPAGRHGLVSAGREALGGGGAVWRMLLRTGTTYADGGGKGGGGVGAGGGACQDGGEGGTAAALTDMEVVGGCDDVADLLAAVACKHWAAANLMSGTGGGHEEPQRAPGRGGG